ncbi:alanine racemase [Ferrimonas marina]|uniref:Alanine racemase n=1 Tax=Ferrimonas marina TaxID=299255 RepID=A0A1M5X6E1_9GAMM|nr:alanine racemase [Ferrimonas marina]SHH95397.1 alanine racemase [Ferrimonas marina]
MRFSPVAEIRRSALHHNIARLRAMAPNSKLMAVVKANAYGHGLVKLASWMDQVDGFGLARIEEALALRESGNRARLVLMEGVFSEADLEQAAQHKLDVVVHDEQQVRLIEQAKLSQPITIWLKVDSGMHRLGVMPADFQRLYGRLCEAAQVAQPINLMTHFASADEQDNPETQRQTDRFESLTAGLPGERTLCNSAGTLTQSGAHQQWVRPGLALYGANPMVGGRAADFDLQPVMTMRSKVLAVRALAAGEPVGYGNTWRTDKDTRIAVVAMGYGDGYPRHAVSGTPVLINGQRYPLVGRVSMDMITVEVGQAPVQVGDDAVLWGQGLPVEEIAECADTIAYELLCSTTARVQYHYID